MLDSRICLTRLWLCSAPATAHHCSSDPVVPDSPGADSCANEQEVQSTDKQATLCPLSRICFTASAFYFLVNPSLNRWSYKMLAFAWLFQGSIPRILIGIYKRQFVEERCSRLYFFLCSKHLPWCADSLLCNSGKSVPRFYVKCQNGFNCVTLDLCPE